MQRTALIFAFSLIFVPSLMSMQQQKLRADKDIDSAIALSFKMVSSAARIVASCQGAQLGIQMGRGYADDFFNSATGNYLREHNPYLMGGILFTGFTLWAAAGGVAGYRIAHAASKKIDDTAERYL